MFQRQLTMEGVIQTYVIRSCLLRLIFIICVVYVIQLYIRAMRA